MGMETSVIERVFQVVEISGYICAVAADVGGISCRAIKSMANIVTVVFAVSGDSHEKKKMYCQPTQ